VTSLHYYSLKQAAEILREPEDRILDYIRSGRVKAQFLTNLMDYIITHEDLMMFLKEKKDFGTMKKVLSYRVVLADRDLQVQDLLKLELGRKNVHVRLATTDREVQLLLADFLPDVVAVPLAATQRAVDPILGGIEKARADRRQVIVYHNLLESVFQSRIDVHVHLQKLRPDVIVNVSQGFTPLMDAIKKGLGLK